MNNFLSQYIKPELMILVPVLYAAGVILKRSLVRKYKIPFILTVIGILLSTIWVLSNMTGFSWHGLLTAIFTGVTQGILVSATSVYFNQLLKQGHEAQACRQCEELKKREKRKRKGKNVKNNRLNTACNMNDMTSAPPDGQKTDE